jgi:hypothetical protein
MFNKKGYKDYEYVMSKVSGAEVDGDMKERESEVGGGD